MDDIKSKDTQKRIDIVYKAIERYEYILNNCNYPEDSINNIKNNLRRELKLLEKYKQLYPEYFI